MQHKSKLPRVKTTIFTIMSALAQKHEAINLSQGFPNFECNEELRDLVTRAMNSGQNQYAPMAGVLELRNEISRKMERLYNVHYNPENEITITAGATQAIFTAISTFVYSNDEVIIFKPAFDCYEPAIELNGGKIVPIQLNAPSFDIDWNEVEKKISLKTKMIIINTPHNPTGRVFTQHDLMELQRITENTNIVVLSDEVYEHVIFDGLQHKSVCKFKGLKSRSIIATSFGKTFHVTGWKIGYCVAPKELMEEFRKVHQFNVFCVHRPSQVAFAAYLKEPSHYLGLSEFYKQKRDLFLEGIEGSKFKWIPSQGTYFQNINYSEITNESDVDFSIRLVSDFKLASIPLSEFNVDNLDFKTLRFCFAKKDDTLKKAAEILNKIS